MKSHETKILEEIHELLKEVRHMFQSLIALITRISVALDTIAANSITPVQAQQLSDALTVLATKAESLATPVPPITITSITPQPVAVGGLLTINGSGFGTVQGKGSVVLNGSPNPVPTSVTTWSDTMLVITVPTGSLTGPGTVTNDSGAKAVLNTTIQ